MGLVTRKKTKIQTELSQQESLVPRLMKKTHTWYAIALVYLFFDYVRPQAFVPVLGYLRPSLITNVLLIGFLLHRGRRYLFQSIQMKLVWAFIAVLGLLIPFCFRNDLAFKTMFSLMLYIPFMVALIACIHCVERWRHFLWFLFWVMTYMSIYMLTHAGMGPGNYFMDENDVSLFIDAMLPFGYFLFLDEKKMWKKVVLIGGLLLGVLSVVISFSRGGFIGLVVVFVIIWLFSPKKILTLAILAMLAGGMYLFSDPGYWKEMDTISDPTENTAQQRLWFWQAGIRMWQAHPFGVGGGNFPVLHDRYQPEEWNGRNNWGRPAHSIWFTLLPETGVQGVLVFLLLLGINYKDFIWMHIKFRKSKEPDDRFIYYQSIAFMASIAGFCAAGTFISVLYYAHFWYLTAFIVAGVTIAQKRLEEIKQAAKLEALESI